MTIHTMAVEVEKKINKVLKNELLVEKLKKQAIVTGENNEVHRAIRKELGLGTLEYGDFSNVAKLPLHHGLKAKVIRTLCTTPEQVSSLFNISRKSALYFCTKQFYDVAIAVYEYFYEKSIKVSELRKIVADAYGLKVTGSGISVHDQHIYKTLRNTFIKRMRMSEENILKIFGSKNQSTVNNIIAGKELINN